MIGLKKRPKWSNLFCNPQSRKYTVGSKHWPTAPQISQKQMDRITFNCTTVITGCIFTDNKWSIQIVQETPPNNRPIASSPLVFFLHCYRKYNWATSDTGFLKRSDAILATQPTVSKHWKNVKKLTYISPRLYQSWYLPSSRQDPLLPSNPLNPSLLADHCARS